MKPNGVELGTVTAESQAKLDEADRRLREAVRVETHLRRVARLYTAREKGH